MLYHTDDKSGLDAAHLLANKGWRNLLYLTNGIEGVMEVKPDLVEGKVAVPLPASLPKKHQLGRQGVYRPSDVSSKKLTMSSLPKKELLKSQKTLAFEPLVQQLANPIKKGRAEVAEKPVHIEMINRLDYQLKDRTIAPKSTKLTDKLTREK